MQDVESCGCVENCAGKRFMEVVPDGSWSEHEEVEAYYRSPIKFVERLVREGTVNAV